MTTPVDVEARSVRPATRPAPGAAVSRPPGSLTTKLFYGSGSLAFGVKDNGFNVFLLLYYNQVLGLSAGLAGLVIGLALVIDSVLDPITGYLSDNLRSRWGRRHPFMYAAAAPAALSYLLLWNPPTGLGQTGLAVYLFVVAVLVRSFITMYEIPSAALGPELSEDYDERTSYMGLRYLFGWVGGVTMYVLAYALFLRPTAAHPVGQLNPDGYHAYAIAASIVMFCTIMISSVGTHGAIKRLRSPPPRRRIPIGTAFKEIVTALGNPSAVALLLCGLLGALVAGVGYAMTPYLYTYLWGLSSGQIAFMGLGSYVSATLAMVVAGAVSKRLGKKRGAIAVGLAYIVIVPIVYLLRVVGWFPQNGSPWLLPLLMTNYVIGIGLSIVPSILVQSMISDVVEDNELKTGLRTEGVLFAANAFLLKSVSGLGLTTAAVLLSVTHFPQKAAPGRVPIDVIDHLVLLYVAVIVVVNLGALYFITRYRISREQHEANLAALAARAEAAGRDDPHFTAPAGT